MDDRFAVRLKDMLAQTEVTPALLDGMLDRLADFAQPYAALLSSAAQQQHLREYVAGLLSRLERKTGEAIAYLHDQERQGLQKFLGQVPWDHAPLVALLAQQVGAALGEPDGVLVFDPSAFAKKGTQSVGVARQWCGRLGKVENCQVGVYLGYVARQDHALVDVRLYLPQEWTTRPKRCRAAGVPKGTRFRPRHDLALEMLDTHGAVLPHAWIAGDDEMGRSSAFRQALRDRGEHYLLAVPSNTRVRDQEVEPPPYAGRGRRPQAPWTRVAAWAAALPATAWTRLEVRDGTKGSAGGHARTAERRERQARLLPGTCAAGDEPGRTAAGGQGRTPHRGVLATGQEPGGAGRRSGAELAGLASSPGVVAPGRVVPQ